MKLLALEVEQFRKFEAAARISGFSDGLNVLCGPNEFGKSTLLAAIRAVLFERHSSKAESVKKLQNWRGGAAPRVAMEFALGDGRWRIEKKFLSQASARLTDAAGAVWEGEQAEEKLQALLDFGSAGRKGAASEQMGVWGALWVTQREAVTQADFSSDLARASVSRCLDAEVGVLTGSERGEKVKREAEAALARLMDGNRRPKDRWKAALEAVSALETSLEGLRGRAERLQADREALRQVLAKKTLADDPAAGRALEEELAEARRRKDAAQVTAERRKAAEAEKASAAHEAQAALKEQEAREARRAAIAAAQEALGKAQAAAKAAREQAAASGAAEAAATREATEAEARAAAAALEARRQRAVLGLTGEAAALAAMQAALEKAEPVQARLEKTQAALRVCRIDKAGIEAVRKALREQESAQAALLAQAATIEIEALADGAMTLDGAPVRQGRRSVPAVRESVIAVVGVGSIRVRPAVQDRAVLTGRVEKAARALEAALAGCGCADAEAAEAAWREREALEEAERVLRGGLAVLAPGDAARGVGAGVAALREQVAVLRHAVEAERARLALDALPERGAAEAASRAAEAEDESAGLMLTELRKTADAAARRHGVDAREEVAAESAARHAGEQHARLVAQAEAAEREEDSAALAARATQAAARLRTQEVLLDVLARDAGSDTLELTAARVRRLEDSIRFRMEQARKLGEQAVELRTRIFGEGGAGLDEAVAAAERRLEELARERDGYAREAEVLRLLLDTLAAAERETKQRYLAPVTRRVTPYLQLLFPGAEIVCDDNLRITGVARDGSSLRAFERLSDGTQEQIAVLSRLAFAELLLDQGKPAMVILDDALAFSDDERMGRMFDVLQVAAERMQILVLSCRADVFSRLGGRRLEVV